MFMYFESLWQDQAEKTTSITSLIVTVVKNQTWSYSARKRKKKRKEKRKEKRKKKKIGCIFLKKENKPGFSWLLKQLYKQPIRNIIAKGYWLE